MKILISSCLLGNNCKYNGNNNSNEKVLKYIEGHEIIPICPEVTGGLTTPRTPSEIKGNKVINKEGIDVTENFNRGAEHALKLAKENNVDLCILKESSPSCGVHTIYDGNFTNNKVTGSGITAKLLKENGFIVLSENDI